MMSRVISIRYESSLPLFHSVEDVVQLVVGEARNRIVQEIVGLGDELHVAVLDPVVNHLHVVAGAAFADPVAAGSPVVDLRGDRLEDLL